jgi:hypothetical protein
MKLNTDHFLNCIETFESSLVHLQVSGPKAIEYKVCRNAIPKSVDELNYKDVLREAAKYHLFITDAVERWFEDRDNRNDMTSNYTMNLANETLKLLPLFLIDAQSLQQIFLKNKGS